jgi:hypothetical protein
MPEPAMEASVNYRPRMDFTLALHGAFALLLSPSANFSERKEKP